MQEKIADIQIRYTDELMAKKNVVGIGIGLAMKEGEYTDEVVLVVMVEQKEPIEALAEEDIIPQEIEGIPVDVQETGPIEAQET